ncbi:MAG: septum formation inhibitor Maf [Deltaproteobacteria bacterium]|nr:septum formation inhibitor Maf [Deltaproteobacteria bacterium]
MADQVAPLVLASASPRRRDILGTLGIRFEVKKSGVPEERRPSEGPEAYVRRLSGEKVDDVLASLAQAGPPPFVLGADTTVVVDGDILDKPRDAAESRGMIERLSGRAHRVLTGVTLGQLGRGQLGSIVVHTTVCFRALDAQTIDAYVASGEGRDKAGAYGIQGLGSGLVEGIEGSYFNVVGLPAAEVIVLLEDHGALRRWP